MAETNLHEKLQEQGYIPEQALAIRKMISAAEKGKRYLLPVTNSKQSVLYQIDGYIINKGNKCDKMVLVHNGDNVWTQIFVELKGVDVSHAVTQLESMLKNATLMHPSHREKRARIVATSFPSNRANPMMEKAKIHFLKTYQCDFRGLKSDQPDTKV